MAYAYDEKQNQLLNAQNDEQKQDNAILTSTAGELGAEVSNAPASGASDRPRDEARQPQRAASQVLSRNQGKAANPFQFEQTRRALSGARQGIQTEKDQYMANAVAPYQTGQQLTEQVQQYAREGGATPEWLKKYQQGTPQALAAFSAQTNTNFAPVNALQTNAGVRSFLRNPADPESRSGEQAIDFSLLNADPNFNLEREGVLRDYGDLLKFRQGVEAETPAAARTAQQAAFDQYKANISGTLTGEADAIQNAARAAEAAYDAQFANLPGMRAQVAREAAAKIAGEAPEDIRGYVRGLEGEDLNAFFNPLDAASTNPEDFISEDQAGDFNRIMGILGRGGPMPTKGRLAGATGPGREALRFDEGAYRNALLNRARTEYDRAKASPFANTGAYDAGGATFPTTAPATPSAPTAGGGGVGYSPEDRLGQSWQQVGDFFSNMGTFDPDVRLPSWGGPGGGLRFSDGGRVPGEPMVPGDSEMNDFVDIKASPGEIVIPRSAAQDKESAKEFIDNMPFGKTRDLLKNKYACGGKVRDNYACGGKVMPKMKGYK